MSAVPHGKRNLKTARTRRPASGRARAPAPGSRRRSSRTPAAARPDPRELRTRGDVLAREDVAGLVAEPVVPEQVVQFGRVLAAGQVATLTALGAHRPAPLRSFCASRSIQCCSPASSVACRYSHMYAIVTGSMLSISRTRD